MVSLLKHPVYGPLFAAQLVALTGTGLMTIALGLLAYDLAGPHAGAVLGTAYAIKMLAYVGLSPIVQAFTERLPRKAVLVGADIIRAAVALCLPFVETVGQVYLLIFVLQAASASFTPTFQALIPDVLPDEEDYTKALTLSRLAYELENLLSPAIAGLLLLVISFSGLFVGTVIGFGVSALLVIRTPLPARPRREKPGPFWRRVTRGGRIYLATPRLRGLLALNLSAAAIGAFVLVNTVVVVRATYDLPAPYLALAMGAFGLGAMCAALILPVLLRQAGDRIVMLAAACGMVGVSLALGLFTALFGWPAWHLMLAVWLGLGACYSGVITPAGRLIRRSAHNTDRPAVFTAQFALSHLCWLITYPLAGWGGRGLGQSTTLILLGLIAAGALWAAGRLWPAGQDRAPEHDHSDLPPDHPHLKAHPMSDHGHRHRLIIDEIHPHWPR
ncbi:Permease,MFS [Actibacterium atlanticum]|uniref:Permease,MFS n=1 Tax=Actibacterium atlanticum TaxID=1461693 RepID=A0A058ZN34_9RHOB|nr:MFS transporter [Actibacterium atlanticum]KCV83034.1 Permease,MFS [Actibacterium atlanticum]